MAKGSKKWLYGSIIIVLIVIALVLGGAYYLYESRKPSYSEEYMEKRDIQTYYVFSGMIDSMNRQNEIAKEMLLITDVVVEKGDLVTEGKSLIGTPKEIIRAEFDGEVTEVYVEDGDQVPIQSPLITIVDYKNLKAIVKVDEYNIDDIQMEQEMSVAVHSIDANVKGKVIAIGKEAISSNSKEGMPQMTTGNTGISYYEVELQLEQSEKLRIGMNVEAKLVREEALNVNSISMNALQFNEDNKPYVLVETGNGQEKRIIEIGINDGMYVEIKGNLESNDKVLVPKDFSIDFKDFNFMGGYMAWPKTF